MNYHRWLRSLLLCSHGVFQVQICFRCSVDVTVITCVCFSEATKSEWKTDTKQPVQKLGFDFYFNYGAGPSTSTNFLIPWLNPIQAQGFIHMRSVCLQNCLISLGRTSCCQASFEVLAHFPVLITRKQYNCVHMCTIHFVRCFWAVIMCWYKLQPWFLHSLWVSTQLEESHTSRCQCFIHERNPLAWTVESAKTHTSTRLTKDCILRPCLRPS